MDTAMLLAMGSSDLAAGRVAHLLLLLLLLLVLLCIRQLNHGMEVGEEPAAGGGEWIFTESRDEVTGRVFDIVDVEHEVDVGQKGEGPRQTGNAFVASSVDGEIFRSE